MLWSSEWSSELAREYQDVIPSQHINKQAFQEAASFCEDLLSGEGSDISADSGFSVELTTTWRQSTTVVTAYGGERSALCLDVAELLALRTLMNQVLGGAAYVETVRLLRDCTALAVHGQISASLGAEIHAIPVEAADSHQVLHKADLEAMKLTLGELAGSLGSGRIGEVIDRFIIAHEVYHYLYQATPRLVSFFSEQSRSLFPKAKRIVCPRLPTFLLRRFLSYDGAISVPSNEVKQARERHRRWRSHFEADRPRIEEEIAADSYAFASLAYGFPGGAAGPLDELLPHLAVIAHVVTSVWDLHRAMIWRALLIHERSARGPKPEHFAETNLRKVALVKFVPSYARRVYSSLLDEQDHRALSDRLAARISAAKLPLDTVLTMPVTRAILEILDRAEPDRTRAERDDIGISVPEWFDPRSVFDPREVDRVLTH